MAFKEKMARLEAIATAMEQEDVDLEASLQLYEEGTALLKDCEKILKETKQKVMILSEDGSEDLFEEEM